MKYFCFCADYISVKAVCYTESNVNVKLFSRSPLLPEEGFNLFDAAL